MKTINFITASVLFLTMTLSFSNYSGAQEVRVEEKVRAKYLELIDEYVEQCRKRQFLEDSKCDAVRTSALDSCFKKAYVERHKNELVSEMIEKGIDAKTYKIRYFLNQKCNDTVKSRYANADLK